MTAPVTLASILSGIEGTLTTDVQAWLVQQYAALQAMPQTIAALSNVQAQLTQIPAVASDPNVSARLSADGASLQGLASGYPAMIAPVNAAFAAVQVARTQGVTVNTGTDVAVAVATAKQFTSGVSTVQNDLVSIVNQALASGAITPAQAAALNSTLNNPTGSGWVKYLLYAAGAYVAWRIFRKVL